MRTNGTSVTRILVAAVVGLAPGIVSQAAAKPLKVFVLAGQSNMQGHAHVRTFDTMELDPNTAPILKEMRHADGTPRVCEKVWISSLGSAEAEQVGRLTVGFGAKVRGPKIGPEFTFGIYMQKLLKEPIVIVKTAWGGKSLHTDFRPPSAGPYEFNARVKVATLTREAAKAATDKLYAETFDPRELRVLRESTSNFEFHYLGSAKIMAQIGKAFAEAMMKLQQAPKGMKPGVT